MRAAILYGQEHIVVEDRPDPGAPAPDEVQIRVRAVGLCGSDLKYFYSGGVSGGIKQPFALGHEAAGDVIAVGSDITAFAPGDRVAIEPGKPCWKCPQCLQGDYNLCPNMYFMASRSRDGALRERLNWPANLVFRLPDRLSYDEGALVEPLSVAFSSVHHAQVTLGTRALVLGAGPIGLAVVQFARLAGAVYVGVTDTEPLRLKLARELGAHEAIDVAHLDGPDLPLAEGSIDVVIDTTGVDRAIAQAFPAIKPAGRLVLVGLNHELLPLSLLQIVYKQLTVQGVYRFKNTYPSVLHYLDEGQIKAGPLMTHRFPLDKADHALRMAARRDEAVKVMIEL
jgi:L-iditol 2-dehydrogenase